MRRRRRPDQHNGAPFRGETVHRRRGEEAAFVEEEAFVEEAEFMEEGAIVGEEHPSVAPPPVVHAADSSCQ